ncbi:MAG: MAP microtubule affinity-regulating kinase 1, partial [Marteilia pararefringens]
MSSDDSSGSLNSNDSRCEKYSELKSRYKILRSIGKGNFAHVKSALHLDTKQHVAIKIINTKKLNEASIIKLEREIEIMKKINHRHIVKLIEVIRGKTYSYIVEELVNGGELFDFLLNSGRMREKDAKKTFYQLISAVLYCHNLKIVHRDLKAENILLDENHNVKLADFGFANFFSSEADLATCCGSPPYAAPELFQAKKYKGPEVDVWSLGVILFTLVTGSLPFDGSDIN